MHGCSNSYAHMYIQYTVPIKRSKRPIKLQYSIQYSMYGVRGVLLRSSVCLWCIHVGRVERFILTSYRRTYPLRISYVLYCSHEVMNM